MKNESDFFHAPGDELEIPSGSVGVSGCSVICVLSLCLLEDNRVRVGAVTGRGNVQELCVPRTSSNR